MLTLSITNEDQTDSHFEKLKYLMELSETERREANNVFFMALKDSYKTGLMTRFEGRDPQDIQKDYQRE